MGDIDFYEVSFFSWKFFSLIRQHFFNISKVTSVYKSAYSSLNANALRFLKTRIEFRRPRNGNGVQAYTNSITFGGRRLLQNFIFSLTFFSFKKNIFVTSQKLPLFTKVHAALEILTHCDFFWHVWNLEDNLMEIMSKIIRIQ